MSAANEAASADRGKTIGLVVVGAITIFASAWLYVHGRAALAAPMHAASTRAAAAADSRFDASTWHLPKDALLGFVEIPAGEFAMGSDPAVDKMAYENERWSPTEKQGQVELPAFYIGRYEVTVDQFADFVAATGHVVDSQALRAPGNHPVTNVTWTDAIAYAHWLETTLRGSSSAPPAIARLLNEGWHVTLPNEAQWEKAARGGDGRIFPWGNVPDPTLANYGRSGTVPVGTTECASCAFALTDMAGNVWELTRSPFQPYPYEASNQPRDPAADALFVMRGGAFNDGDANVRAAIRGGIDPGAARPFIGFRLVLSKSG